MKSGHPYGLAGVHSRPGLPKVLRLPPRCNFICFYFFYAMRSGVTMATRADSPAKLLPVGNMGIPDLDQTDLERMMGKLG